MSNEKQRDEALRWLRQSQSDLEAAQHSAQGTKYEWACFQAQQAAEKAVKALWIAHDLDPWGHSVRALIEHCPNESIRAALDALRNKASALDKLYIPTRYPNGLPDVAPTDSYTNDEADTAIGAAHEIIRVAQSLLK